MKKILISCLTIMMIVVMCGATQVTHAENLSTVYVNSEQIKNEGLEKLLDAIIVDDGGYANGTPGEYTVKYKFLDYEAVVDREEDRPYIEREITLIVVQSKGTVIDFYSANGYITNMTKEQSDTLRDIQDPDEYTYEYEAMVNEVTDTYVRVRNNDGSIEVLSTDIVMSPDEYYVRNFNAHGDLEVDEDGSVTYRYSFTPSIAQRYLYTRNEGHSEKEVEYYNPAGNDMESEFRGQFYMNFLGVYTSPTRAAYLLQDQNNGIIVRTNARSLWGQSNEYMSLRIAEASLDNEIINTLNADQYKAMDLALVDDSEVYTIEDVDITMQLDNQLQNGDVKIYQYKTDTVMQQRSRSTTKEQVMGASLDNNLVEIKATINNGKVEFTAPEVPARYIVVSSKNNSSNGGTGLQNGTPSNAGKDESKKAGTVKTDDTTNIVLYSIILLLSVSGLVVIRKKYIL